MCGYQLLTQAGNITKILQSMKELKKQQKSYSNLQQEASIKQIRPFTAGTTSVANRARKPLIAAGNGIAGGIGETEKLQQQKRDLQIKLEQKRSKVSRLED